MKASISTWGPVAYRITIRECSTFARCGSKECTSCASGTCGACSKCLGACPACFSYEGSTRSGCSWPPSRVSPPPIIPGCESGATQSDCSSPCLSVLWSCEPFPKLELKELLKSEFWLNHFYQALEFEWQPTLFQPVGGMDKIVDGFKRKLGNMIKYEREVQDIKLLSDGVSVTFLDKATNKKATKRADFCIGNIPMPVLNGISYVVGDQASTLPGWQEGAMMSAEHVIRQLVPQVSPALAAPTQMAPESIPVPNTRRVVRGRS